MNTQKQTRRSKAGEQSSSISSPPSTRATTGSQPIFSQTPVQAPVHAAVHQVPVRTHPVQASVQDPPVHVDMQVPPQTHVHVPAREAREPRQEWRARGERGEGAPPFENNSFRQNALERRINNIVRRKLRMAQKRGKGTPWTPQCHAPPYVPSCAGAHTPLYAPIPQPHVTPYAAPYAASYAAPYAASYAAPYATPYATPYVTPHAIPSYPSCPPPSCPPYGSPYISGHVQYH